MMTPPSGPAVDATVKWFKGDKGFGFVELADGSGDAFLHIGAVQAAGHDTVGPGAKLKVQVGQGQKGPQVLRVLEVDESSVVEQPPRFGGGGFGGGGDRGGFGSPRPQRRAVDPSTAVELGGTVKWFNGEKGFGFIAGEDGGKDVFVHISVLERAGLRALNEGERVSMRVVETPKGREAISIDLP
jgi:CspA family cold shock protein